MNNWIRVEDELPKNRGEYIVAYHPCYWDDVNYNEISVGMDSYRKTKEYSNKSWAEHKYQRVIAWMPKLNPPEKD